MTSHELAQRLLNGPNLPILLCVATAKDAYIADVGECDLKVDDIDVETMHLRGYPRTKPGQQVSLVGWMSSEIGSEDDEDEVE